MSLAQLKAAGIPRANILSYAQDWAPVLFQNVAEGFRWNEYAILQMWGNLQEQLEEDAAAALHKW